MVSRLEIDDKPVLQLILILCLCLISTIFFSAVGGVIAVFFFGIDLSSLNNFSDSTVIQGLKIVQLFSAIGLFLVPPILYALLTSDKPLLKLSLYRLSKPGNYLLVSLLMITSTAFITWIIELNASMILPDFLSGIEQWMRSSEKRAEELTRAFLTFDGIGSLLYTLIIVAVIPAFGEELLFRGVLQRIFIKWVNNPHVGIWITAILFSALHMQFFGFLPRLLLGLVFGYIFLWTRSLWLPIFAHFINNGTIVIASYFYPEAIEGSDISYFSENGGVFYMISFMVSSLLLYFIYSINKSKNDKNQNKSPLTV